MCQAGRCGFTEDHAVMGHRFIYPEVEMIKRFKARTVALFMMGAMVFVPFAQNVSYVSADEETESEAELERKKKEAEDKIDDAKGKLAGLENDMNQVREVVEELDTQIGEYNTKISELVDERVTIQAEIAVTQLRIQNAYYEEQLQYDNMKERIQYAYENGNTAYIDALMNVDDFKNMLNESEYTAQVSSYDQGQLERLYQIRSSIEMYKELLNRNLAKVDDLTEEAKTEQEALQVMVDGKRDVMIQLDMEIDQTEGEISELTAQRDAFDAQLAQIVAAAAAAEEARRQEEAARLERLRQQREEEERQRELERQRQEEAAQDTASDTDASYDDTDDSGDDYYEEEEYVEREYYTGGGLLWPMPSSHMITDYFGYRDAPTAGASTFHQGLDIGCSMYAPAIAAASGTVTAAGYTPWSGNYITIYHGEGLSTTYMHLSDFAVSTGDYVSAGQVIAYAGSTGISTGPHLHFEVMIDGERTDPLNYLY